MLQFSYNSLTVCKTGSRQGNPRFQVGMNGLWFYRIRIHEKSWIQSHEHHGYGAMHNHGYGAANNHDTFPDSAQNFAYSIWYT